MSLSGKFRMRAGQRAVGVSCVVAAGLAMSTVVPLTAAAQGPPTRLVVNDPRGTGLVGDDTLSLAEAIRLAQGTLRVDELGAAERAQVRGGRPGAGHRDLIAIALPPGARVTVEAQLPVLRGMDGDTIDGRGVELRPDPTAPPSPEPVLKLTSSHLTVRGLGLAGFVNGIEIAPGDAGSLRNVVVADNRFQVTGNAMTVLGATGSGDAGAVRGVTLSDNRIAANPDGTNAIAVRVLGSPGGAAEGEVEGVRIHANTIGEGWGFGIYLAGIQSAGENSLAGGRLDDVTVVGNTVRRPVYDAVAVYGGLAFLTEIAGARTSDVDIAGNWLTPGSSSAVNLQAAYTFAGGSARDATLTGVRVRNNAVVATDRPDRCGGAGIRVQGTLSEANGGVIGPSPGVISGNRTSEILVAGNVVSGCPRGVLVAGADHPWPTGGAISANAVRNVDVKNNRLTGNDVAVMVAGALMFAHPDLPAGDAVVHDNHVERVTVSLNTFSDNGRDVWVLGGGARDAVGTHRVTANSVTAFTFKDNPSAQGTCVLDENYVEHSTAQVFGNTIQDARCKT